MDEAAKIDGWQLVRCIFPYHCPHDRAFAGNGCRADLHVQLGGFHGRSALPEQTGNLHRRLCAEECSNDSSMSDYGATFAMSAASLVPILVLFFFFQKNLVEGISIQGLKG